MSKHKHDHKKTPKGKHRVRGHHWHQGKLDWRDFPFDTLEEALAFVAEVHGILYDELRIYNEYDVITHQFGKKPVAPAPATYA